MSETPTTAWHVPDAVLRGYAEDRVRDADAWSVEAHLGQCPRCRRALAGAVEGTGVGTLLEGVRGRLLDDLPAQSHVPPPTAARRAWLLSTGGGGARSAWLIAVLATVVVAVALDALGGAGKHGSGLAAGWLSPGGLLLVVAPLLPLVGVALSYGAFDPARELVASTASAGLGLVLWRTLAVLVVSMPPVLVAGLVVGRTAPILWLLPSLALTTLAVVLGSFVELSRAALGVGVGWLVVVIGPGLTESTPVLLESRVAPLWVAVLLLGGAVLVARRDAFSHHPLPLGREAS